MSGQRSSPAPWNKGGVGWCSACGKMSFPSRKQAKKSSQDYGGMSAYQCPRLPDGATTLWHVGHLPAIVRTGTITRDQLTPARPQPSCSCPLKGTSPTCERHGDDGAIARRNARR